MFSRMRQEYKELESSSAWAEVKSRWNEGREGEFPISGMVSMQSPLNYFNLLNITEFDTTQHLKSRIWCLKGSFYRHYTRVLCWWHCRIYSVRHWFFPLFHRSGAIIVVEFTRPLLSFFFKLCDVNTGVAKGGWRAEWDADVRQCSGTLHCSCAPRAHTPGAARPHHRAFDSAAATGGSHVEGKSHFWTNLVVIVYKPVILFMQEPRNLILLLLGA